MQRTRCLLGIMGVCSLLLGAAMWTAAQPAKAAFKLKLMGINRAVDNFKAYEQWGRVVEQRTNGRVTFDVTSLPELGLGGAEIVRVLKTGVVDIAEIYGGFVAGELPLIEIVELPGVFPDAATAKQAHQAWKPHFAKLLEEKANAVLLARAVYPEQVFFSKKPLRSLQDFKGLKTRVHSVVLSHLVAGLGGQPLTIPFAEVYTALERGTLDAAITGTKPGADVKLFEVSKYLAGPIGLRPHVGIAINKDIWRKLPGDVREIMQEEALKVIEDPSADLVERLNRDGIAINEKHGMESLTFSPEVVAAIREVARTKIVPDWVRRAGGKDAAQLFNQIIAPLVGFPVAQQQ
jgi:TRAP-type C4-dicarboxylate transport system substrate-binding protein